MWEFPGGKIEQDETSESALRCEILEEPGIDINIDNFLYMTEYYYPSLHLKMHCYPCKIISGEIEFREHKPDRRLTTGPSITHRCTHIDKSHGNS